MITSRELNELTTFVELESDDVCDFPPQDKEHSLAVYGAGESVRIQA